MLYRVIDDNGTKKREALVGVGYGMPLGSVVELVDTIQLPDGYLLCDGSTFDETKYPALYAYLGSNTLPVKTSHSSGWTETIDLLTSTKFPGLPQAKQGTAANAFEVPYDGVVGVRFSVFNNGAGFAEFHIIRNGVNIQPGQAAIFPAAAGYNNTFACEAEVRRGDLVYVNDSRVTNFWYSYSNKFKAIKATPAGSGDISDVGALITRNASYSETETLTGGTWIDNKPIYRKVFTWPNVGLASGWNNVIQLTADFNPETLVNARWLTTTSGVGVSFGFFRIYNGYIQFYSPGVTWECSGAILEYTKA